MDSTITYINRSSSALGRESITSHCSSGKKRYRSIANRRISGTMISRKTCTHLLIRIDQHPSQTSHSQTPHPYTFNSQPNSSPPTSPPQNPPSTLLATAHLHHNTPLTTHPHHPSSPPPSNGSPPAPQTACSAPVSDTTTIPLSRTSQAHMILIDWR